MGLKVNTWVRVSRTWTRQDQEPVLTAYSNLPEVVRFISQHTLDTLFIYTATEPCSGTLPPRTEEMLLVWISARTETSLYCSFQGAWYQPQKKMLVKQHLLFMELCCAQGWLYLFTNVHKPSFKYLAFRSQLPVSAGKVGLRKMAKKNIIRWRRKWQPTPIFLPGKSHRQRSLAGYSPWGRKQTQLSD